MKIRNYIQAQVTNESRNTKQYIPTHKGVFGTLTETDGGKQERTVVLRNARGFWDFRIEWYQQKTTQIFRDTNSMVQVVAPIKLVVRGLGVQLRRVHQHYDLPATNIQQQQFSKRIHVCLLFQMVFNLLLIRVKNGEKGKRNTQ